MFHEKCMQNCQKLQRSRGARLETIEDLRPWLQWLTNNEKSVRSYFTSLRFDGEHWRDWVTGMNRTFCHPSYICNMSLHFYPGEIESEDFYVGLDNKELRQECGLWGNFYGETFSDYSCTPAEAEEISCPCENKRPVYLTIRGLCPKSYIDTFVMPRNEVDMDFVLGKLNIYKDIIQCLTPLNACSY